MEMLALVEQNVSSLNTIKSVNSNSNGGRYNKTSVGTVDLSGGHDWSGANTKSFFLKYDGGAWNEIVLDANCADLAAIVTHIQTKINAIYSGFTVSSTGAKYVALSVGNLHYFVFQVGGTALVQIGWSELYYFGDLQLWSKTDTASSGTVYIETCPIINFDVPELPIYSYSNADIWGYSTSILRVINNVMYCILIYQAGTADNVYILYSTDGGINWTTSSIWSDVLGATPVVPFDIFISTGGTIVLSFVEYTVTYNLRFYTSAGVLLGSKSLKNQNSAYPGQIGDNGDDYYFVWKDASDNIKRSYLDISAASFSDATLTGISSPSTFSIARQRYSNVNGFEILVDNDYIQTSLNGLSWVKYTASGTNAVGIIWYYTSTGYYLPRFIIWNTFIWKVKPNGAIVPILSFSSGARIGFSVDDIGTLDWFNDWNSSKIYLIDKVSVTG